MIESYFCNGHTVHTFQKSGSVQRKPGSGRPKVRTEEHIKTIQRQIEDEPQLSLRQLSQQTELSVSTCQRIVRKDLEYS
jgi:transposase